MKWLKQKNNAINPFSLDWGKITADGDNGKEIIHVFNSDMTNKNIGLLTKSFILNKYKYYSKHIPSDRNQVFVLDLRGQNLSKKEIETIENDLKIEIHKIDNNTNVKIEFKL
jgi:hypothetical protein